MLARDLRVRLLITALCATLMTLGLGVIAQQAKAGGATVTVSPNSGLSETHPTTVQVTVSGAQANAAITVTEEEASNGGVTYGTGDVSGMTDANGDAVVSYSVAYSEPGQFSSCTNDPAAGDKCVIYVFYGTNNSVGIAPYSPLSFLSSPPYNDPGQVAENTSWPNATVPAASGTQGSNGASKLSTSDLLSAAGQARWYKVPIIPGESVSVTLSGLTQNYDLTLYKDISQAYASVSSPQDLARLSAEFAGDAYSPSIYSPSIYSPSIYSPSIYSPSIYSPSIYSPSSFDPGVSSPSTTFEQAFSSAQSRSLLGISAQDGTADESITANTWSNTGYFYVRVLGRNGAFDPSNPFTLNVTTSGGVCDGVSNTYPNDKDPLGTPGTAKTVIVTDTGRLSLTGSALSTYQGTLNQLAAATGGVVVDLAANQRVTDLHKEADAHASCPYAQNLVAAAIRQVINSYRDSSGTLQDVVIAGDDDVIPFFRYPDTSGLGPEQGYVPPVTDSSPAQAALRDDVVLGQDAYGSTVDLSVKGSVLPLPDLPVGRLVETPSEIEGMVDSFLQLPDGTIPTSSSLVTGYDFLTGSADSVESDLEAGMASSATHDQLITNQGVPTTTTTGAGGPSRSTSWTAADLRNALFGIHHDVVYLAGHFSANSALAADYTTSITTDELAAHPYLLKDSLVFSAGCHSGYNLPDDDAVPGVTDPLDWAQAMAEQRATLVAGTGYQYADTDFLAYSAKLYALMAHHLRDGSAGTPTSIAGALVAAKQQYLSGVTSLTGIDDKTLIEATVYGLPMTGVDLPNRNPATTAPTAISPTTVSSGPGQTLQLETAAVSVNPQLTVNTRAALDTSGNPTGQSYRWLSGPDGVSTAPALPALPLQSMNVSSSDGSVVRGVGFRSGTYADTGGVLPLTGAVATEQDGVHTTFGSPAFFPQQLYSVNYFGAISGGQTRLNVTPAQYRSSGSASDTERAYSALGLQLFYSSNTTTYGSNTPALAAPPSIGGVAGTTNGSAVAVTAHATGDPSAGIQQVWVTYTAESGPLHGQWQSVDLTQSSSDSTSWSGSIPLPNGQSPSAVRYLVQAANGVGEVSLDDNLGDGYVPDLPVGNIPSGATATSVTLDAAPASIPFGTTVVLGATLSGAPAGSALSFDLGDGPVPATTDSSGRATVAIPVRSVTGPVVISAVYAGDATHAPSKASAASTVGLLPSVLTLTRSSATATSGSDLGVSAALTTSAGAPLAQRSVDWLLTSGSTTVGHISTITDTAGVAQLGAVSLPAGSVTVTASFGSTTAGQTPDPTYAAASAMTTLTISTPLLIHDPGTVSVPATSAAGAAVSYTVTADGPDGGETASCNAPSGSTFAIGDTTVQCQATDGALTTTDTFTVHVQEPAETLSLAANQVQDIIGLPGTAMTDATSAANDLLTGAESQNFSDGTRLSPASSTAFFKDLTAAEKQLAAAAKTKKLPASLKAQLLVVEQSVDQVADLEAAVRIADATAAGDSSAMLAKANAAYAKGRSAAAKKQYTKGVPDFGSAWAAA